MIRNGVRAGWAVLAMLMVLLAPVAGGAVVTHLFSAGSVRAMESASAGRRPLTEEEGQRVAEAALAYAQFEFESAGAMYTGMPYLWGGRTTIEQFSVAVAEALEAAEAMPAPASESSASDDGVGLDEDAVPVVTPVAAPEDVLPSALSEFGVDASGLAVNALRSLGPGVRFAATVGDDPVWWADATSAMLHDFNVVAVDGSRLRAGDLVFFGTTRDGDVSVSGVGVVTGRTGTRVDFVVASAREGRVIQTFARTDGDYWRGNIVGAGRFLMKD